MVRIRSLLIIVHIFIFILTLLTATGAYAEYATPVLLSFDTEMEEDATALRSLNISEPATYFVTGEFVAAKIDYRFLIGRFSLTQHDDRLN